MQQEQKLILKMLEEGKITAEEAEALLNAIGEGPSVTESEPQEDPWVRIEKMGEEFASKVEVATERFSRSLEQKAEGFGDKLHKQLPKILAKFPFFSYEENQEFTTVVRGTVTPKEKIPINLSNANGPIRVQGWSEEYYQLTVVQRLRGRDRESARSRIFDVKWADGEEREDFILVVPGSQNDGSISLHLMVPENLLYEVKLTSQNGSLRLENLRGTEFMVDTTNGSALLKSIKGARVEGQGSNGSCEMEGVEAAVVRYRLGNGSYRLAVLSSDLKCRTANGSVNVRLPEIHGDNNYELRTTNGSITINLPTHKDVDLALQLETSVGRISSEVEGMEIVQQQRQGGGGIFEARSTDRTPKTARLALKASTTSGSIRVSEGDQSRKE